MNPEFIEIYTMFTVHSIHDTFELGFRKGTERRIPFAAKNEPEHTKWLDEVCSKYKEEYGTEIEYFFDKICFWKEKSNI